MHINIEVFDREVIENIITCLNFPMDKVIFFGQHDTMTGEVKERTEWALRNLCDVKNVSFEEVSMKNIDRVLEEITKVVQREEKQGGKCFFDLTGGADTVLVALGMYSATHNIPMHCYDIPDGELKILNTDADHIDRCVKSRHIPLTIDKLIKLQGGKVDYSMQKKAKENLDDLSFRRNINDLWQLANANIRQWNGFSTVLKATKTAADSVLEECLNREKVQRIAGSNNAIGSESVFIYYLKQLEQIRCIENLVIQSRQITFRYKSSHLRSYIWDAGSVLEIYTYFDRQESGLYDDCKIGTHLKWGVDSSDDGYKVNNEVDVLLLRDYTLTFISCKSGTIDQMALYELDTVASRFGGKYAVKELVTASSVDAHHRQRAEEMGISVISV